MPKYTMIITETVVHNINVEAQDKDTAWNEAVELWQGCKHGEYIVEGDIVDIELVSDDGWDASEVDYSKHKMSDDWPIDRADD